MLERPNHHVDPTAAYWQKRAVAAERELARIRESVREIQDEARAPMKATDARRCSSMTHSQKTKLPLCLSANRLGGSAWLEHASLLPENSALTSADEGAVAPKVASRTFEEEVKDEPTWPMAYGEFSPAGKISMESPFMPRNSWGMVHNNARLREDMFSEGDDEDFIYHVEQPSGLGACVMRFLRVPGYAEEREWLQCSGKRRIAGDSASEDSLGEGDSEINSLLRDMERMPPYTPIPVAEQSEGGAKQPPPVEFFQKIYSLGLAGDWLNGSPLDKTLKQACCIEEIKCPNSNSLVFRRLRLLRRLSSKTSRKRRNNIQLGSRSSGRKNPDQAVQEASS
ncbi:g2951 [Coccomyxa viridis]|uniref:G2951 protein n=1 Tax=Coccomyxa viridis TaxID=1274662 RepID=A0ABP1FLM3_9CHLO